MKNFLVKASLLLVSNLIFISTGYAMADDDPVLVSAMIDQLEVRDAGNDPVVWDARLWAGKDIQKFYLKTEGEHVNGETVRSEVRALYARAIAPYWDVMVGVKKDFDPDPKRNWLEIGAQGLAPYFFDIDASLFIGESGRSGARLVAEYEWMLTQKWVLSPKIEVNAYGHNDEDTGTGSGLSTLEAGLRLRYEVRREFAPYIGINWEKAYGNTADFQRANGEELSDTRVVVGLRAWF
jgi:copper resistance protein B